MLWVRAWVIQELSLSLSLSVYIYVRCRRPATMEAEIGSALAVLSCDVYSAVCSANFWYYIVYINIYRRISVCLRQADGDQSYWSSSFSFKSILIKRWFMFPVCLCRYDRGNSIALTPCGGGGLDPDELKSGLFMARPWPDHNLTQLSKIRCKFEGNTF